MKISCSYGNNFEVTRDSFAYETDVTEKNMGAETEHYFIFEDGCENQECDNQIVIELRIWEYPQGNIEDHEINENEGKLKGWKLSDFISPLE